MIYAAVQDFMNMDYNLLDELNARGDNWAIKVQAFWILKAVNLKMNNELISLDMILVDEQVYFLYFCYFDM